MKKLKGYISSRKLLNGDYVTQNSKFNYKRVL